LAHGTRFHCENNIWQYGYLRTVSRIANKLVVKLFCDFLILSHAAVLNSILFLSVMLIFVSGCLLSANRSAGAKFSFPVSRDTFGSVSSFRYSKQCKNSSKKIDKKKSFEHTLEMLLRFMEKITEESTFSCCSFNTVAVKTCQKCFKQIVGPPK